MRTALSLILLTLILMGSLGIIGQCRELRVPAAYSSIQSAVDAARSGDIIHISPGIYRENVVIDHKSDVLLRSGACLTLDAEIPCWDSVALADSCLIVGTVQVLSCHQLSIEGLTIFSPKVAIYIDGSKACFASDIAIRYCNLVSGQGAAVGLGSHYRRLSISCTNAYLLDGRTQSIIESSAPYLDDVLLTCSRTQFKLSPLDLDEGAAARVVVAVIDSGIDFSLPAISCRRWTNPWEIPGNGLDDDENGYIDDIHGWDFRDNDPDAISGSPIHWHGTFVAGVLIDTIESGLPTGVPCTIEIMDLRFLDAEAQFYSTDWRRFVDAIDYAVHQGARIINLSLYATRPPPDFVHEAIRRAIAADVLVVAIAGNDAADLGPIANWREVVTVGAVNRDSELAAFSNVGEELDVVSVGVDVLSLVPGGSTRTYSGTSFAAPRVAGIAALHLANHSELNSWELADWLIRSAVDIGDSGHDPQTGWGLVE
jgi:Subtilase family